MARTKFILAKIPKFLLSWFVLDIILLIIWVSGPNNSNKVVVAAALTVGLLSFLFYEENRLFIGWLAQRNRLNKTKFFMLGFIGAVLIELIFLFWDKALGSGHLPTGPNFIFYLILTLPLYFLIITSFWFIQKHLNLPLSQVFILGGVYELIVDGLIGGFLKGSILLSFSYGLIGLPIFMVIYSLILFPSALFLKKIKTQSFNSSGVNI